MEHFEDGMDSTFADNADEDPNISNAKLASFFKEKGDRPLSEMEIEGVISVMKKCRSVSSTPYTSRIISESGSARDNKILRSKSEAVGTPLRAAQYNPKFDETSFANSSLRSARSSVTRRVFDYSKLPSPYRTTVYKYSAAGTKPKSAPANDNKNKVSRNRTTPKKLSNTASALISILDGAQESNENEINKIAKTSKVANPYSTYVTRIRKGKMQHELNVPVTPAKLAAESAILNESLASKKENSEDIQSKGSNEIRKLSSQPVSHVEAKKDAVSIEDSKRINDENQTNTLNLDKYKPSKSSSLRQTVTAKLSPEKLKETGSSSEPSVPISNFNFSFKKVEPVHSKDTLGDVKKPNTEKNENPSSPSLHFTFGGVQGASILKPAEHDVEFNSGKPLTHTNFDSFRLADQPSRASDLQDLSKGHEVFDFGDIPNSTIDKNSVDQAKVNQLRSMFIF